MVKYLTKTNMFINCLGFIGGKPGDSRGGGGFGGETYYCPMERNMGKGGDVTVNGKSWRINTNGIGSGGAGDGPQARKGNWFNTNRRMSYPICVRLVLTDVCMNETVSTVSAYHC